MNERAIAFCAAGLGVVLVSSLTFVRWRGSIVAPKVISQRIVGVGGQSRGRIEIKIAPPQNRPKPVEEEDERELEY